MTVIALDRGFYPIDLKGKITMQDIKDTIGAPGSFSVAADPAKGITEATSPQAFAEQLVARIKALEDAAGG